MRTVNFLVSALDYRKFVQAQLAWSLIKPIALFSIISAILELIALLSRKSHFLFALQVGLIGAVVFYVLMLAISNFILIPRRVRTAFREQISLLEEKSLSFDHNSFEINQPSGLFRSTWEQIVAWRETSTVIALYINRFSSIPISKKDIGDEMVEAIKANLIKSGLERPRKLRKR